MLFGITLSHVKLSHHCTALRNILMEKVVRFMNGFMVLVYHANGHECTQCDTTLN